MIDMLLPLLLAPIIGSFLGVVIRRLPAGRDFVRGRSRCDSCDEVLQPWDLVPVLSYLVRRGRCGYCGLKIGSFHLAVELAALAIAIISVLTDHGSRIWLDCALGWWLLTASWIDAEHFELPDMLTLPLILTGLGVTAILDPDMLFAHAIGTVCGYLGFQFVARSYRLLRHRDGLGEGDARLLAAAGAWLGWAMLPQLILIAAVGGLIFALVTALAGRKIEATTMIPFGPFLALGLWILWLVTGAVEF